MRWAPHPARWRSARQPALCRQHRQQHSVGDRHRHLPGGRTASLGQHGFLTHRAGAQWHPVVCGQPRQQHGVGDRHRNQPAYRHQPEPFGTVAVGSSPSALAVSGDRLYVANTGSGTVSVINTPTTYAHGGRQPSMNGGRLAQLGDAQPRRQPGLRRQRHGHLAVIDTKNQHRVRHRHDRPDCRNTAATSSRSAPDGSRVYVTDAVDRTVRVLTITRGNTAPVTTAAPTVDAPDLATGAVSGALNVTDPDGDALDYTVSGVPTDHWNGHRRPHRHLHLHPDPGQPATSPAQTPGDAAPPSPYRRRRPRGHHRRHRHRARSIRDPRHCRSTAPISVGSDPNGVAISGNEVYAFSASDKTVSVIDTSTTPGYCHRARRPHGRARGGHTHR